MPIDVYKGNDWAILIPVKQTADSVTSDYDLTGATIVASIGVPVKWTGTPAVIDAITGKVEIQVPAATTATFAQNHYPGDIVVTKAGVKRTVTTFILNVKPVVTPP